MGARGVQITRDIYQAFKKHVDEQDQIRVQEWHAAQEAAEATGAPPAAKALKPPTKPTLGKAVAHACQLLVQHVKASPQNEEDVQAAFRDFQTVWLLPVHMASASHVAGLRAPSSAFRYF